MDKELFEHQIRVERKRFSFYLKENEQGRYLKVTEEVGGRRGTIIVPANGLREVANALCKAADINEIDTEQRPPPPPDLFEPLP